MTGIQMIKVTLQRDSLHTPWGFRLQGGADFCMPFVINKITAGSPADGALHRGDVILEIDQRPISAMHHSEALQIVQRAGGQITFLVERGLGPLAAISHHQRPMSALPWSLSNTASYLEKTINTYLPPAATNSPLSPTDLYRSRPLERIRDPKPVLSQTGSPLMPGPVPSVSTKTRGYTKPPVFHTERHNASGISPADYSYYTTHQDNHSSPIPFSSWNDGSNQESHVYLPSYQKKVAANPVVQRRNLNDMHNQRNHQHYRTIARPQQQQQPQQHYRPPSVQPVNLVNRQYNSPMSLYSNDNVQEVMKNHVNHITRVSIIPSTPNPPRVNYAVAVTPAHITANAPVCYVQSKPNVFASEF